MSSEKVGIITFHRSNNCGSILQAYALQTVLKEKLKVENEIIDFSNEGQQRLYATLIKPRRFKDILQNGLYGLFYVPIERHRKDYVSYVERIFKLSPKRYRTSDEMKGIEADYTALICGSDQVWNTECHDADDAYFLDFATNTKKIAYAASLGAQNILNLGEKQIQHYRKLLADFDFISVRENNAQKWISQLTDKEVCITADPTLLLSKSEWEKMAAKQVYPDKYIFYYSFSYEDNITKVVKEVSKKTGLPVIVMDAKHWVRRKLFLKGIRLVKHASPAIFLSLIQNAELVMTTSLHGTIFSTRFEKKFWYINGKNRSDGDDRTSSLLGQLGLKNRYVTGDQLSKRDVFEAIDYSLCKDQIQPLVDYSMAYLEKAVK